MNRRECLQTAGFVLAGLPSGLLAAPATAAPAATKTGPVVVVITCHPGMPAASIEKDITNRIERWVNHAAGVRTIASRSIAGVSIIDIAFDKDVNPVSALAQIGSLTEDGLSFLPPNTRRPVVMPRPPLLSPRWEEANGRMPAGVVTVASPALGEALLRSVADIFVRKQLHAIPGLIAPAVLGGKDRVLVINLKPEEMEARHLSLLDVKMALHRANLATSFAVSAVFGDNQLLLKTNKEIDKAGKEIKELSKLPIRSEPDNQVYLRDIGVFNDAALLPTSLLRIDGRRGVCLPVYFAAAGDEDANDERMTNALAFGQKHLPREHKIKLDWMPLHQRRKDGRADDDGLLTLHLRAPSNLRLEAVEKRVAAVERFLKENIPATERTVILAELGVRADLWAAYTSNAGQQDATLRVQLSRERTRSTSEYVRLLRSRFLKDPAFADLRIVLAASDLPKPIALRIRSGDAEQAANLARELCNRTKAIEGTADVFVVERQDAPCLVIKVDQAKAASIGLTQADVLSQAVAAFSVLDLPLLSLEMGGNSIPLRIQYPENPDFNLDELLHVAVTGTNKHPVKLSSLASFRRTTEAVEIHHVDSSRVFNVRVGIDDRDRRDVIADIRKMLEEVKVPEGMRVDLVE